MPLSFNDQEQQDAFEAHLQVLADADAASNVRDGYTGAQSAAMVLLKAPKTLDNEAELQRLLGIAKMRMTSRRLEGGGS